LKTFVILYILVLLSSAASAEIYRWEDANGVNFTDDSSAIPEKYREKPPAEPSAETGVQPVNSNPQPRIGEMYQQNRQAVSRANQAAAHQASLERHRRAVEAKKQQQINRRDFETTLQSLAKFVVIWVMLGGCLFVIWVATLVDIVRSRFTTPSGKAVWLLLVLFLPLLGMVPYLILGANRKCNPVNSRESQPFPVACPVKSG